VLALFWMWQAQVCAIKPKPTDDTELSLTIIRLAKQYGWYGYRKVTVLLCINQSKAVTQGQISMKLKTLPKRILVKTDV
jgi:hypothetical protein